jgi:hypothetical protein
MGFVVKALIFALCLLASTASSAAIVFVEDNPFRSYIAVRTTPIKVTAQAGGGDAQWELSGLVSKGSVPNGADPVSMMLRISVVYSGDWRFYKSAYFYGGQELKAISAPGRTVLGCRAPSFLVPSICNYLEQLAFEIPRDYKRYIAGDNAGLSIQVEGAYPINLLVPLELIEEVWRRADSFKPAASTAQSQPVAGSLPAATEDRVDPCAKRLLPSDRPPECARQ